MIPRLYGPYWTFLDNAVVPKRGSICNKIMQQFQIITDEITRTISIKPPKSHQKAGSRYIAG